MNIIYSSGFRLNRTGENNNRKGIVMKVNLKDINNRIGLFIEYFIANTSSDPRRHFELLQLKSHDLDNWPEEKLYYVFLATHFDSPILASDFYQKMRWKELQHSSESNIRKTCVDYFRGKKFKGDYCIGSHRKYFRCLKTTAKKVDYTVKILASYKEAMNRYGSQVDFFEINNSQAEFDVLYKKMEEENIEGFDKRLPRFDHLERLSRVYNFYVTPERLYIEEASGPLYGLTYLLCGKRLGKDEKNSTITNGVFITDWNEKIGGRYTIPDGTSLKEIMKCLEQWVINSIRGWKSLPHSKMNDKAFIFDLESCLCNYQKSGTKDGKKRYVNGSC